MNKVNKFARFSVPALVAAGSLAAMSSAHAVIDTAAATTGIADAQTAVLVVLGSMITMGAAIFGVKRILRLIGR
ncbi:MAG: major capsid protein [Polaromonas sp.]|nr:major capsid protein [Polaromonas sp.]